MTMLVYIDNYRFPPSKQEVSDAGSEDDAEAQPDVVRHEDQHEAVTDEHLNHVKHGLYKVAATHHVDTENRNNKIL
jgi:hypothetical protein